ncbi:MAG: pyruvate, phosphate dikinase [Rhodospirillaceae bacterium]|nr:pyruvate, phosphate dikinase [Rhodospirillaceae bacterium]MBT4689304.1 pyruvate, phosphate dikinase [Rhodospirillaceae bacterium]MBT5081224.1 pyruvate, phosphate dikinase [Rhodospirillaceae bacterium]MBT5522644.1 pyruvate, phosphate dikinase [Rhodospirillaceae bacterium]MBT5880044.1 pyruvate, phosphate dikinase [Rhodospirillaceae bacterium]
MAGDMVRQVDGSARRPFQFGTKAQTLAALAPLVTSAQVLDLYFFTVTEWRNDPDAVLAQITERFGTIALVVRSSAHAEDQGDASMAGAFESKLNVDGGDPKAVTTAVKDVIDSYVGHPDDQVLVQAMLDDVAISGVAMTHDVERGAPFYVVDYDDESGRTDTVTGGDSVHKTVIVFRDADLELVESPRIRAVLALVREVEILCGGVPLDMEFAMQGDGSMYLLQARRISLQRNWLSGTERRVSKRLEFVEQYLTERSLPRPGLGGERTILGIMPDWNPAEMIGIVPRPLAASLYRQLVTRNVWSRARERMGYRAMPNEELMVMIGGRPYIDVRNSFNSFLPAGVSDQVADRLVNAWLNRLADHPELHDKVEFAVAQTCLDCCFDEDFNGHYQGVLSTDEAADFRNRLAALTNHCLNLGPSGTLSWSLEMIEDLTTKQTLRKLNPDAGRPREPFSVAADLLLECEVSGTIPFSIVARHAFIGEALLKSLARRGAIGDDRLDTFKRSVRTISGELTSDFAAVCHGGFSPDTFMMRYGHLRPGTYDIMSLRYDHRNELFEGSALGAEPQVPKFDLTGGERENINKVLAESGITAVDADSLLDYARRTIAGREYAKFIFSANISDALEAIATWGENIGLDREHLSYIEFDAMIDARVKPLLDDIDLHFIDLAEQGRRNVAMAQSLKLGYILRDRRDIYVVPLHRAAPNFVGSERAVAAPVVLGPLASSATDIYNRIVCIENADPGYDWIFTKGIKGLVTKFGGANSHMAIRCAEFGLSAAIGCGEGTFERLLGARAIEVDPLSKTLRAVDN